MSSDEGLTTRFTIRLYNSEKLYLATDSIDRNERQTIVFRNKDEEMPFAFNLECVGFSDFSNKKQEPQADGIYLPDSVIPLKRNDSLDIFFLYRKDEVVNVFKKYPHARDDIFISYEDYMKSIFREGAFIIYRFYGKEYLIEFPTNANL